VSNSKSIDLSESETPKKHNTRTKSKLLGVPKGSKRFFNNIGLIAYLVFLAPVGLFLMFKKSDWSKKSKMVATSLIGALWALVIVSAIFAPPTVTLSNIEQGKVQSVEGESFNIIGSVYPYDSVVTVNDEIVKVGDQGKIDYDVPLKEGDNIIKVVAKKDDKMSTSMYKIHRYTKAEIAKRKADDAARLKREEEAKAVADKKAADIKAAEEAADAKTKSDAKAKADADAAAAAAKAKADAATVSQKNALNKATSYLSYTAFSHDGLVDQLVYEQFSVADATYGADNVGANWNEQAAKKAKSYMSYSSFSRGGLIDQLVYEKFTPEQAAYGASAVGL